MMSIEERIVSLGFNNQNFERHAQESMNTLNKLDKTLDAFGGEKGMNLLTSTLEAVSNKFSVLGTIGDQVLRKLTDSVMGLIGQMTNLAKSMSFDQISAGFEKFGNKTTAVATLVSQGFELERVKQLMSDLNWFTDETSYNFTDMVGEIAKFTAAGQGLEESVTAMEGIALWAALSGQNASVASRAMMQLSQAMTKGSLRFDDWKSIQNANMDTQEFRKQAVEAAVAVGTLKEVMAGVYETTDKTAKAGQQFSFAQLFSSDAMTRTSWLSSDAMMKVFNTYSKAVKELQRYMEDNDLDTASDAMNKLEAEAKELADTMGISLNEAFKQLGYDIDEFSLKAFRAGQEARTWKDVVDSVKDAVSTGWMNTFEWIIGDAKEATRVYTDLANGLWEIFAGGGETRNEALKFWSECGDRAKLFTQETGALYKLGSSFLKLFDELHWGLLKIFGPDVKVVNGEMEYEVAQLAFIFRTLTDRIVKAADAFEFFVDEIVKNDVFGNIFEGLHQIWKGIKVPFELISREFHKAFDPIKKFPTEHPWMSALADTLTKISEKIAEIGTKFNRWMHSSKTVSELTLIAKGLANALDIAKQSVTTLFDSLKKSKILSELKKMFQLIISDLATLSAHIMKFNNWLKESGAYERVGTTLTKVFDTFASVLKVVFEIARNFVQFVSVNLPKLEPIVSKILDFVDKAADKVTEYLNKLWESGKIENFYGKLSEVVDSLSDGLSGVLDVLGKIADFIFAHSPIETLIDVISKLAEFVGKAFKLISESFDKTFSSGNNAGTSISKLALFFAGLFLTIRKAMTGASIKNFFDTITDFLDHIKGLIGGGNGISVKSLKNVAISIGILAGSLVLLSMVDADRLKASVGAITFGLGEMLGVIKLLSIMGKAEKDVITDLIKVAAAILIFSLAIENLSVSLLIVSLAIRIIANLDPLKIATAVIALMVSLVIMAQVLGLLAKKCKEEAASMLAAGAALMMLGIGALFVAGAVALLSLINWKKLAAGVGALVLAMGALGAIIGVMAYWCYPEDLLAAAAAMLIVSVAILALTAALVVLSLIPWDKLTYSVIMLGVGLAVMAIILALLSNVALQALAAGAAMLLIGVGALALAAAVLVLAVALNVLKPLKKDIPALAGGLALLGLALLPLALAGVIMAIGALGLLAFIPFAKSLKSLDGIDLKSMAVGLLLLAPAMLALSIAGIALVLGAPGLLLGGAALVVFGFGLQKLGAGMEAMEGVGLKELAAIAAGLTLLALAGIPLLLGAPGLLLGTPALLALGEAMPTIAEGFKSFEGVNWSDIGKGAVALAAAVTALFVLEFATIRDGTPVLKSLGEALPSIANGFKAFEGANWGDIAKGMVALGSSVGILFSLQFATIRDGTPALLTLGQALPEIANGFKSFETLNAEMILNTGKALAITLKEIFMLQFATFVDGTTALINLGHALPVLAEGFRAFQGMAPEWVEMMATSLANGIKVLLGNVFSNMFKGGIDFEEVAYGIRMLATAVAMIPEDSEARITALSTGIMSLSTIIVESITAAATELTNFATTLDPTLAGIVQSFESTLTKAIQDFETFKNRFTTSLNQMITMANLRLMVGFTQMNQTVMMATTQMTTTMALAMTTLQTIVGNAASNMYYLGVMIGQGLANGLYSQLGAVQQAASALASAAQAGVSSGLEINSPSRVMQELGEFAAEGLSQGIQNGSDAVEESMIMVIDPLLAALSTLMDEDFDISPSITPVVDMSNAQSAAGELSSLFSGGNSYSVSAAGRIAANESTSGSGFGNTSNIANTTNATINVYAQPGQNINELATEIERRLVRLNKQQRLGALA